MNPRALIPSLALLLTAPVAPLLAEAQPWPQQDSDLKPDANARYGMLDNGLRFVVLPNAEPPGRASLRLYMDVGSLMEEDDQQGMAHFLEHMAFNGSRNFPAGEMIEYFQRLGMAFGADTNAHTSFNETVYKLELPKVEEPLLVDAMRLFRDYLDGMTLAAEEIESERGIILSEKLSRDSIDYRTMVEGYKFALPKSLLPTRLPIGTEETIKSMPRERFVDFYGKWYHSGRATVVAVGDFEDLDRVEELIREHFEDAPLPEAPAPDPDLGVIESGTGLTAMLHTEMEAKAVDMSIEVVSPATPKADTAQVRRDKLVRSLADAMINQRLSKLAKETDSPILSASAYSYEYLDHVRTAGMMASSKPENWGAALSLIEQELRRAIEHGFTDAEFEEARATQLKRLRLASDQAATRRSRDLSNQIVSQTSAGRVFTHPKDDLARISKALEGITIEDTHTSLIEDWNSPDIQLFVGGKLKLDGDAAETIIETYLASRETQVEAPAQEETAAFAYTDFGTPGEVVDRKHLEDLDITQVTFSNQVRVSIKPTEFEKGTIRVTAQFGGGKLTVPLDKPGMLQFAQGTFILGGLEAHDVDELRRIFASRTVGRDFSIQDGSFLLSGSTTPADLESQLQLLAATLVAPGYRPEAEEQFRRNLEPLYVQLQHTASGIMNDEVVSYIHNDDPRFGYPPLDRLRGRNLDELRAWLEPELKDSFLEVSIVGDVDPEAALKAVGSTFGALPAREAEKPSYTERRLVSFPEAPRAESFPFSTEIPKAIAAIYWPTTDMSDISKTRRLLMLGSVLDDRLRIKVREELGETYSPACYHVSNDTFTGYGYMAAMIEVKPEQLDSITELVGGIAEELASGSISDDEFERAMAPNLSQLEQMRRDNRYWSSSVLKSAHERPERLEWARNLISDFKSITKEEIEALAKEYLAKDRIVAAKVIPITDEAEGE